MSINSTLNQRNGSWRITLGDLGVLFATAAVLVAPFTWSYLASVGGMLIRAVDLVLLMAITVSFGRFRLARLPAIVLGCLIAIVFLKLLRSGVYSDPSATVSAIKISYYLMSALALATAFRARSAKDNDRLTIYALLLVSPILITFISVFSSIFLELLQSRSFLSMSQVIFQGWNQIFSGNLFGVSGPLEVSGNQFRNTAGIGFLVAALYFYLWDGVLNRTLTIILMVVAALFFSRSVWMIQLLFFALVIMRSKGAGRIVWLFLMLGVAIGIAAVPDVVRALDERLSSNLGRLEMLKLAVDELEFSILFGRPDGARLVLSASESIGVHNVPLALALELGILGLLLSATIAAVFLYTAISRFFYLFAANHANSKPTIVIILISTILFMRPMISASYPVYFSIGEWCALAIYLAFVRQTGSRAHGLRSD